MNSSNTRPRWWQLYLMLPLLIVLFIFEHRLNISPRGHEAVQLGIILLVYGFITWWIRANSHTLSRMDQQYYRKYTVVETSPLQSSPLSEERSRILQLPDSEVRGVLSDTFEIDRFSQEL